MTKCINFTDKEEKVLEDLKREWLFKYDTETIKKAIIGNNIYNNAIYDENNLVGFIRFKYENNIMVVLDTFIKDEKYLIDILKYLFQLFDHNKANQIELLNGVDKRITDVVDKYGKEIEEGSEIKIGEFIDKLYN